MTARAHGCDEIFDSQYTPSNAEEMDLLVEKQKFIYLVFEESILNDIGKYYVRLHEKDYDAQEIFRRIQPDKNELPSNIIKSKHENDLI